MLQAINGIEKNNNFNKIETRALTQGLKVNTTLPVDTFEKSNVTFKGKTIAALCNKFRKVDLVAAKGTMRKDLNAWKDELCRLERKDLFDSKLLLVFSILGSLGAFHAIMYKDIKKDVEQLIDNIKTIRPDLEKYEIDEKVADIRRANYNDIPSAKKRLENKEYVEKTPIAAANDLLLINGIKNFKLTFDYTEKDFNTVKQLLSNIEQEDSYSSLTKETLKILNNYCSIPEFEFNKCILEHYRRFHYEPW